MGSARKPDTHEGPGRTEDNLLFLPLRDKELILKRACSNEETVHVRGSVQDSGSGVWAVGRGGAGARGRETLTDHRVCQSNWPSSAPKGIIGQR